MKPATLILSLLLVSAAVAAEPVFVIASVGNLRKAPGGELVEQLPINTPLLRLGSKGDWSAVERTVDGRVVRGFLASALLATAPLTMEAALEGWRDGETTAAKRSWAERAMALDEDDPRALAAYVAALRASGDETKLQGVLKVVDKRYERLVGPPPEGAPSRATLLSEASTPSLPSLAGAHAASIPLERQRAALVGGDPPAVVPGALPQVASRRYVRWLASVVGLPEAGPGRALAQSLYEGQLRRGARALYGGAPTVARRSAAELREDIRAFSGSGRPALTSPSLLKVLTFYGHTSERDVRGFWIRRYNGRIADEVAFALEKLMVLYDAEGLLRGVVPRRAGGGLFPSPGARHTPRSVDRVQAAWGLYVRDAREAEGRLQPAPAHAIIGSGLAVVPGGERRMAFTARDGAVAFSTRLLPECALVAHSLLSSYERPASTRPADVTLEQGGSTCTDEDQESEDGCPYESFAYVVRRHGEELFREDAMSARLVEPGDLNGDGHDDVVVVTTQYPDGALTVILLGPEPEVAGGCRATVGG